MKRKIVIVTGTTNGIGLEMAKILANDGYKVIMACRDISKAQQVKNDIISQNKESDVEVFKIDMASFESIKEFVKAFTDKHDRLDVLINNAGVYCDKLATTDDGFEMTMGVNYLGSYLLTRLLLPTLIKNAEARIINITSKSAFYGKLQLDATTFTSRRHGFKAYSASKLAQLLFTIDLAEELRETGVTVNAAYPGRVATNIWNGDTLLMKIVAPIMNRKSITAAEGAKTGVFLATSAQVAGITGKMYEFEEVVEYPPVCLNVTLRKKLMELSCEAISKAMK